MIFTNILLFCLVLIEGCNLLIRLIKFSKHFVPGSYADNDNDNEDIPPIDEHFMPGNYVDEEIRKRMYA